MARRPNRRSKEAGPRLPRAPSPEAEGHGDPLAGLEGEALREALDSLTVKDLRAQAKAWSVNLRGRWRKGDIVDLLLAAAVPPREEPQEEATGEIPQDFDLPFGQLDDLWIEAANCLDRGDDRAAIALSRDALNRIGEWTRTYMQGMCARALTAAKRLTGRYEDGEASQALHEIIDHVQRAYEQGDLMGCARQIGDLQREIANAHMREVGRLREILSDRETVLQNLKGLSIDATAAQDLLAKAEEASTLDEHERALELIHQFDEMVKKTRERRVGELRDYLAAVEARIEVAEDLGRSLKEARKLVEQARVALDHNDLVLCDQIARRCEETALEAQRRQIEKAMELRREYFRQVRALVTRLKPTLKEAETYGIDIEEPRALLRESLDLLRQNEYLDALTRAEAAQRALEGLLPEIVVAREGDGVAKPQEGACRACDSADVEFSDDGWAECHACGHRHRWRREGPRLLSMLRQRLVRR
ncbi:MAG: hypothetical protein ACE5LS_04140 [Thermoplasmata archaeon]